MFSIPVRDTRRFIGGPRAVDKPEGNGGRSSGIDSTWSWIPTAEIPAAGSEFPVMKRREFGGSGRAKGRKPEDRVPNRLGIGPFPRSMPKVGRAKTIVFPGFWSLSRLSFSDDHTRFPRPKIESMYAPLLQFLMLIFAGWVNRYLSVLQTRPPALESSNSANGCRDHACPSSLIHFQPMQLSGVRAYSDGEARRPGEMRRPPRFLGVRSVALQERPFLVRGGFDPRGSSQRTTGSHAEAGAH